MEAKLAAKLLYVEDDAAAREPLRAALGRRIEEVLVAVDGVQGLEVFRASRPDLVVTDIAMPGVGGLTMARQIKTEFPGTPVIVTTAHSDTGYFLEAIEIGIDGYVLKPIAFPALFEAIHRVYGALDHRREEARHHAERERLLKELQEAISHVKLLSGLLPICASCKKIRDDHGYWQQIEAYLLSHSEARFSHGMCPECTRKLYPEFCDD